MSRQIVLLAVVAGFALAPAVAAMTTFTRSTQEVRIGNASTPNVGMTPPRLRSYTRPIYTDDARRRGIEGVVTVEAAFDIDGNFNALRVVKGLGYGLDENALAALKKWRFSPAYRNGQKVSVVTQVDVNFSLFDDPWWLGERARTAEIRERQFWIESIRWAVERWENELKD